MITSQRAELPSKIKVYYATWARLGLSGAVRKLPVAGESDLPLFSDHSACGRSITWNQRSRGNHMPILRQTEPYAHYRRYTEDGLAARTKARARFPRSSLSAGRRSRPRWSGPSNSPWTARGSDINR
jgi:hypothetical protein